MKKTGLSNGNFVRNNGISKRIVECKEHFNAFFGKQNFILYEALEPLPITPENLRLIILDPIDRKGQKCIFKHADGGKMLLRIEEVKTVKRPYSHVVEILYYKPDSFGSTPEYSLGSTGVNFIHQVQNFCALHDIQL